MKKFKLGQIVLTRGVARWVHESNTHPATYLTKHENGEWGDMCDEDKASNERALNPMSPERIMSVYELGDITLWIITEWDRSVTTLLFPEEY